MKFKILTCCIPVLFLFIVGVYGEKKAAQTDSKLIQPEITRQIVNVSANIIATDRFANK